MRVSGREARQKPRKSRRRNEAMTRLPKKWRRRGAIFCTSLAVLVSVAALIVAWPMNTSRYLTTTASSELLDRNGKPLYAFLSEAETWCFPVPLENISPLLVKATIATEDQRFNSHFGVDPLATARAAWSNVSNGRIKSGASTLTMQIVKQASASKRSYSGKALQMIQAIRLDARVDKNTLLETYLNRAPYGLNLAGCEAASRRYFGKSAKELTLPEAALLAGLPQAPSTYMPIEHTATALARRNFVLKRMHTKGFIDDASYKQASAAPLNARRHEFAALSPHLALRYKNRAHAVHELRTTIVKPYQQRAEYLVREAVKRCNGSVGNGAAIVLDVSTAEVLARVGSANFFDTPGGGQVDACRAARSPGSALKPFTYALAIERDCLYPSEVLLDNLLDYGRYQPVNFDGTYRGLVTASTALKRSLNVPAVAVLDRVGYENVYTLLQRLGFSTLSHEPAYYGLGLTLGNCEIKLEDAAAAYATIASMGEYKRPVTILGDQSAATRRLKPGTCAAIYDMLGQPLPTEFDQNYFPSVNSATRVCWKTGTSTGFHDAWAIVFNAHYVVAVWLGNNDGRSSRMLVGARTALPLAAAIFRSLPPKTSNDWPETRDYLKEVSICAVSGLPATENCEQMKTTQVPREQYLHRVCDVHRPATDEDGAMFAVARSVEHWPGSARNWDLAHVGNASVIEAKNALNIEARQDALRIISPANKSEFVLTGEKQGDRIRLESSQDKQSPLHWYCDGTYLGASSPTDPLYLDLTEGEHKLTCMDPSGAQDSVMYAVQKPGRPLWR
jgi:penicillin-binding protein 1C